MFLHTICERATSVPFSKHSGEHIENFCEIYVYLDKHFMVLERCLEPVIFTPFLMWNALFVKNYTFFMKITCFL